MVISVALSAPANVIHLKNGRTIWADHVREDKNKDRVEYNVGDDTYAIPKSSIDRIDAGGVAPVHASQGSTPVPDITPPAPVFQQATEIADKIIRDGKVDTDALSALSQGGNPELSATGYFLAGKFESDHGNFPQAPPLLPRRPCVPAR